MDIYEKLIEARNNNDSIAVATVVKAEGSTPRSAGSKMICYSDGTVFGSVGGGIVEKNVIKDSLLCIKSCSPLLKTYSATPQNTQPDGYVCGNNMTIFIEPLLSAPMLYLCGGGHVAQAMIPLAKKLGYYVTVIDSREPGDFMENLSKADSFIKIDSFKNIDAVTFKPDSYFLVCTFAHALDGCVLKTVLEHQPKYAGMLGGLPKIKTLFQALREQGVAEETLRTVHTPAGLDIGGETPDDVALSIMAEINAVRYRKTGGFSYHQIRTQVFPEQTES